MTTDESFPTLTRLLKPTTAPGFLENFWERKPLAIHRGDATYFASLLTRNDVDRLIAESGIRSPEIRIVKDGQTIPLASLHMSDFTTNALLHEALIERYRDGATVVLNFLNERWPPLSTLCEDLSRELSAASLQANIYITPRNSQGFAAHYDTHDVFVIQVAGSKAWRVYDQPGAALPLEGSHDVQVHVTAAEPHSDFILEAGDCAYIPRGWVHEAASQDNSSIHVTLGIHTVKWTDVFTKGLESLFEDERFRQSLTPGFVTDPAVRRRQVERLDELLDAFALSWEDRDSMVEEAAIIADRGGQRRSPGRLLDVDDEIFVSMQTPIRRRPEIVYNTDVDDETAVLAFNGKVIFIPLRAVRELDFILRTDVFTPRDLPGELDNAGRVTLVRRLVLEGFLEVMRSDSRSST